MQQALFFTPKYKVVQNVASTIFGSHNLIAHFSLNLNIYFIYSTTLRLYILQLCSLKRDTHTHSLLFSQTHPIALHSYL